MHINNVEGLSSMLIQNTLSVRLIYAHRPADICSVFSPTWSVLAHCMNPVCISELCDVSWCLSKLKVISRFPWSDVENVCSIKRPQRWKLWLFCLVNWFHKNIWAIISKCIGFSISTLKTMFGRKPCRKELQHFAHILYCTWPPMLIGDWIAAILCVWVRANQACRTN